MLSILIVRPGCTEFDAQGRIKGSLDIPLNAEGQHQVAQTVDQLSDKAITAIYQAPCQSAAQMADALSQATGAKVRELDALANLDHGLWHGKLIDDVKRSQPKVYKRWRENPASVCPPEGETVGAAATRAQKAIRKIVKRHKHGVVAVVASEPIASVMASLLNDSDLGNLWHSECDCGNWETIDVEPESVLAGKS
jgi:broad specificity phosphatase PhoE